jgi:hypothetical protein
MINRFEASIRCAASDVTWPGGAMAAIVSSCSTMSAGVAWLDPAVSTNPPVMTVGLFAMATSDVRVAPSCGSTNAARYP